MEDRNIRNTRYRGKFILLAGLLFSVPVLIISLKKFVLVRILGNTRLQVQKYNIAINIATVISLDIFTLKSS